MNTKLVWNIINSLFILGTLLYLFLGMKKEKDVVYVDNVKLFKEFNMTKELGDLNEKKYKPMLKEYDSLMSAYSLLENRFKIKTPTNREKKEFENIQVLVLEKDRELKEIRYTVKEDINRQVWSRLNKYIGDYAKEKKIDLVLGAQGQGNIMYGIEAIDITADFIDYANYKYEGN